MNVRLCVCGHKLQDHEILSVKGASVQGKGWCTMIDEEGVRCECLAYEKRKEKKAA